MSDAPPVLATPERIADDGGAGTAAWPVVLRTDRAPERGGHAEHLEEVSRNEQPLDIANLAPRREIESSVGERDQLGESLLLGADFVPQRQGQLFVAPGVPAAAWAVETDLGELLRAGNGKTPQPQGVQQTEHCAVGADPKRERHDRGAHEGRRPTKQADAKPNVLPQRFDRRAAARVAHLILD